MPTRTRPIAYPAVPAETLGALTEVLERRAPLGSVDRTRLEEDLLLALHATGVAHDGSAGAELWHEATDTGPDHKALARAYGQLAEAPDPLDPTVSTPELRSELNRRLHRRREDRGEKASLASIEREEIRARARHLQTWHKSHVRAHRPRKNVLDTLLLLLGDVFARHGGSGIGHRDLPHSVEGQFIRFAALFLAPFYDASEVSQIALASRWKRMKPAPNDDAP